MTTPADIKKELLAALSSVSDASLKHVGFLRKRGSLTYARMLNDSHQQITFVVDCFPKYQPKAEAHIHPTLQLSMPEVSKTALALVKGNRMLLADAPEIIVNEPIEFTGPKDKHERWFAAGEDQFTVACESINTFLFCWVIPFLSEISTSQDLVRLYETNDPRIMKQRHWHIFVAAAYQILGRFEEARELVLRQFGSAGLRKRYAPLFLSLGIE